MSDELRIIKQGAGDRIHVTQIRGDQPRALRGVGSGGGGTSDYNKLKNKPSIGGVTLEGDKSLTDLGIDIPDKVSQLENDTGYITGIDSGDVTTALGYTPYNATNPNGYVDATGAANAAPVQSVNGQTGDVSLAIPTVPTNVSAFNNDAGYLTSETDPTVPAWAKQPNKPTYTAAEVGALPDDAEVVLGYDEAVSVDYAEVGDAVTADPMYTPSGTVAYTAEDVAANLTYTYTDNYELILHVALAKPVLTSIGGFTGAGVTFKAEITEGE